MIATPPRPSCHDTRVAAAIAVKMTADLFDGHERVGSACHKTSRNGRYVFARIIGPVPMRLRVTVRKTPDGGYLVSARPSS